MLQEKGIIIIYDLVYKLISEPEERCIIFFSSGFIFTFGAVFLIIARFFVLAFF